MYALNIDKDTRPLVIVWLPCRVGMLKKIGHADRLTEHKQRVASSVHSSAPLISLFRVTNRSDFWVL